MLKTTIESAYSSLTSISSKLRKRNKLVRIAGKSEAGWLTIEEYQNDSAASDSDDSQKICQTEQRALRKQNKIFSLSKILLFYFPRAF